MKTEKNILIITKSSWTENSAFGNTLSNFFTGWESFKFSNIFLREELPENFICDEYYNITERQILNIFKETGKTLNKSTINKNENPVHVNKTSKIKHITNISRLYFRDISYLFANILWETKRWKNSGLNNFLTTNCPDIVFAAGADPVYLQKIINYCLKTTNAKLVLFFADDIYNLKSWNPFDILNTFWLRKILHQNVTNAAILYGASQKLCEEYGKIFGREIKPLYKGCSFENEPKKTVSSPIKIVYAGNLFYGRWKILSKLIDTLEQLNKDSIKVKLEIYTTATITKKMNKALNRKNVSKIVGARPYEEIKKILSEADIVLHVESFEKKEIKRTRLSFSTKIIDCMQSGSCLLAIGPEEVASIEYLQETDGAIVVTDINKIGENFKNLIENPEIIIQNARKLREFAKKHHDIENVRKNLQNDFISD